MRQLAALVIILLSGCTHVNKVVKTDTSVSRSSEYQKEIDELLAVDAENKRWERIYLKEIAIAQDNNDPESYKFFIIEYIKLPRMILPEWMKKEPGYVEPVQASDVLRGLFRIKIRVAE